jgi:site-specific DNA recombinase
MKGIIYCRVSSHDQVQGTSLENQRAACEAYAQNKNILIEEVFIEKGESATAATRTEFLKALDYCKDHKEVGAFIVWKVDRFARNTTDHFGVRAKLIQYGTTLHSVTEPITDDPQGQLMETMLAGFAQFENEIRKQRCTSGMQGSLRRGLYVWDSKLGYKRPKKKVRRVTEPDILDENIAPLLKKGMELYAEGNTSISTLGQLSKKWRLYTRTGIPLYKQRWSELLEDKYYAGILTDPWTNEEYLGQHEPLISLETYEKIQLVKKYYVRNKGQRIQQHPDFPLRRFVKCPACKQFLTGSKSKGRKEYYAYYHCKNKNCAEYGHSIKKDVLERGFLEFLSTVTPKEEYLRLFEATVLKVWKDKRNNLTQQHNSYQERLSALEVRKARINEMRAEGDIGKIEYKQMKADLDDRITALKISQNETEINELDMEVRLNYVIQHMRNITRIWQDLPIDQQIRFQRVVLPEGIEYDKMSGKFGTAHLSYICTLFVDFPVKESCLVAGPGIEPGSGGYEPPEVPLLYPAICCCTLPLLVPTGPVQVVDIYSKYLATSCESTPYFLTPLYAFYNLYDVAAEKVLQKNKVARLYDI